MWHYCKSQRVMSLEATYWSEDPGGMLPGCPSSCLRNLACLFQQLPIRVALHLLKREKRDYSQTVMWFGFLWLKSRLKWFLTKQNERHTNNMAAIEKFSLPMPTWAMHTFNVGDDQVVRLCAWLGAQVFGLRLRVVLAHVDSVEGHQVGTIGHGPIEWVTSGWHTFFLCYRERFITGNANDLQI